MDPMMWPLIDVTIVPYVSSIQGHCGEVGWFHLSQRQQAVSRGFFQEIAGLIKGEYTGG